MDKIFLKTLIPENKRQYNKIQDSYDEEFDAGYSFVIMSLIDKGLTITEAFHVLFNSPWQKMNERMGVHGYATGIFLEERILKWLDDNNWDIDKISNGQSIDPEVLL